MPVKLLMTWDIAPEQEQEYFQFVIREFIPGIQRIGLEPLEAWATIYGKYPQILVAILAPDLPAAQKALNSGDWKTLRNKLLNFVTNYSYKVVDARRGFQF